MTNEFVDPHTLPLAPELHQLEKKWLEVIYRNVADCLFLLSVEPDACYRFVSANEEFFTVTGLTRERVIGRRVEEVIPESAHALVLDKYREALSENRTVSWEEVSTYPKGRRIGEVKVTPMRDEATGQVYLVGAVRDITLLREEGDTLRRSEELLRTLLQSFPNGTVCVLDRDLRFIVAEGADLSLVNLTSKELVGRTVYEMFPQQMVDFVAPYYLRVFEGETVGFELPFNGQTYSISAAPLRDESDDIYAALVVSLNITERKQLEENLWQSRAELRLSEERFRAMIEHSSDIISVHDAHGIMLYQSPSIERILGYKPDELIGKQVLDYIHPEQLEHTKNEIQKVRSSPGSHPSFETRFLHKNGAWIWVECSGTNLLDNPSFEKILFNSRDITARKLAEDALRKSEAELRALFAVMSDVIFVFDGEGRYLKVAPTNPDILYRKSDELAGKRLHEIFPEPTADLFLGYIRRALTTRKRVSAEYSLNIGGNDLWFVSTIAPMTEETVVWIARDITDIKQAERALREREDLYRETVENANDIIYTLELSGRYLSINRAGERITGYTRDEIRQMTFADIIAPEYVDFVRRKMEDKLRAGGETTYELEIKAKDGRRIAVEVNSRILEKNDVPVAVLGIARDITERKRTEEKLRQIEEQLRQSQKLESVGLLAGGIAHDFNNMLTVINGYSDLILKQLGHDDPLRRKVEEIRNAGEKAGALTYQLLAFSRKQILQTKTLNINEIVSDISKMLQRLIGEDIDLTVILNERLGHVETDPGQITQVLMNLAVNARDAMPSGGKLIIETDNVYLDETYASQHVAVQAGRYVMLAVSDNGTGIDEETRERIFEPFFTTKEVGKGTGMGLATVYGIIKQSGGNIWVYSEVGHGTTFKIYLPRVDKEAESIEEEMLDTDWPPGTEKILLVEDEYLVRDLSKQILEMCGYTVLEASDGAEAFNICEEDGCHIDLLITDVVMPNIGGRELVKLLAASRPSLRVLYISGYTDHAIVHQGVLDEGTNFIQKPFTPEAFAKKVRDVLDAPKI